MLFNNKAHRFIPEGHRGGTMNLWHLAVYLILSAATTVFAGERQNTNITVTPVSCGDGFTCERIVGNSKGNHEIDCTVILPDPLQSGRSYPVIAWANGWGQGNVNGQCVTSGYLPGLKDWAAGGPYIVVAANAWSARGHDVLQCLEHVVESGQYPAANANLVGLSGHSQGGGAVVKAGDGGKTGINITATIPMNPYGPSWVDTGNQDGPMLLLGGDSDTTTPVGSFIGVWDEVQYSQSGSILAVHLGGTHNNDAWGVNGDGSTMTCEEAASVPFSPTYSSATALWWDLHLNQNPAARGELEELLGGADWCVSYPGSPNC
jgi:dienelactone hydrolase